MQRLGLVATLVFSPGLAPAERQAFARMLEFPDQVLLEWLTGKIVPADPEMRHLVQAIRRPPEG